MIRWIALALGAFLVAVTIATILTHQLVAPELKGVPLAVGLVVGWLLLVVFYYAWAIYRYNVNLGLGDEEWSKLQRDDRSPEESADQPSAGGPDRNPYESESFGMPPGTVRGTLALSALVLFLATEIVNLQNPGLEGKVSELITAFQMVLAFYFGARAVEVLEKRQQGARAAAARPAAAAAADETVARKPPEEQAPARIALASAAPITIPEVGGLDRPAMSSTISSIRLVQVAMPGGPILPLPGIPGSAQPIALVRRVLALTSSFETGVGFPQTCGIATGNFDGQGLSFGALQWNIGQGSLQRLWQRMQDEHPQVLKGVLGSEYPAFQRMLAGSLQQQMDWALSIQRTESRNGKTVWLISEGWKKRLMDLGVTAEMIDVEVDDAAHRFEVALANCKAYGLTSERGVALMFDINVQNGKVDRKGAGASIQTDFAGILPSLSREDLEVERMRVIANRRADVVDGAWREDVRRRKLTIADGRGRVHGHDYDLAREFFITLAEASPPPPALA